MISIITTMKDAEPWIEDMLDSVLAQNIEDWELIIANDHSSDDSYAIVEDYSVRDNRIRLVQHKGPGGIIPGLRTAFSHARGEMVTRMDSDDKMTNDKLRLLSTALAKGGRGSVAVGQIKHFAEGGVGGGFRRYEQWINNLTAEGRNYEGLYRECTIPSSCWMMYKEDFDSIGAFASDWYPEDYDLAFRMYGKRLKIAPVKKVLFYWRDHPARASRNLSQYEEQTYFPLKLHYYKKFDFDKSRPLVVYGAGTKGKKLIKAMKQQNMNPLWVTGNEKKWGVNIYGVVVQPPRLLEELNNPEIFVAISSPVEVATLMRELWSKRYKPRLFC